MSTSVPLADPDSVVTLDVAPPKRWRRWIPAWLRALIWVDAAPRYDGFLSYSWSCDKEIAPVVQSVLQRFLCPWYRVRAKTIFRDLSCLPAGSSLTRELLGRLDRSDHLIALASPAAATSRGMEQEAVQWLSRSRSGQIIVVVTESPANVDSGTQTQSYTDTWQGVRDNLLPPALRNHFATTTPVWIPLARHRRDMLEQPRNAVIRARLVDDLKQLFLRLYPGMTWEALQGEERSQRRKALRLVTGLAALFLIAALTIVFELLHIMKDNRELLRVNREIEAADARIVAADAETRKVYGAVVTYSDSISKVAARYLPDGNQLPGSDLSTDLLKPLQDLGSRLKGTTTETPEAATAKLQIDEFLWNSLYVGGKLRDASQVATDKFKVAEEWGRKDPANPDWWHYMIRAKENLPDELRAGGALVQSEADFRDAVALSVALDRPPRAGPASLRWKNELPHARERLGDVLRDEGKFAQALQEYRSFLQFSGDGGDVVWQRNLAVVHGKIGDMLVEHQDPAAAEQEFQTNLELSRTLARLVPNNADAQRGIAVALERLGFVQRLQGRLTEAARSYQLELEYTDKLTERDRSNIWWHRDQALAREGLADVLCDRHQWRKALPYYEEYAHTLERLSGDFPTNARLRHDLAVGYQRLGDPLVPVGERSAALDKFRLCVTVSGTGTAAFDPRNPEPRDPRNYCQRRIAQVTHGSTKVVAN